MKKCELFECKVDMSKVNMDVMKPWIATRVTQLLGFEDEVLINFIYELLGGKVSCRMRKSISVNHISVSLINRRETSAFRTTTLADYNWLISFILIETECIYLPY